MQIPQKETCQPTAPKPASSKDTPIIDPSEIDLFNTDANQEEGCEQAAEDISHEEDNSQDGDVNQEEESEDKLEKMVNTAHYLLSAPCSSFLNKTVRCQENVEYFILASLVPFKR